MSFSGEFVAFDLFSQTVCRFVVSWRELKQLGLFFQTIYPVVMKNLRDYVFFLTKCRLWAINKFWVAPFWAYVNQSFLLCTFHIWGKRTNNTGQSSVVIVFFCIGRVKLLKNICAFVRRLSEASVTEMASPIRKSINCGNCGTPTTRDSVVRLKKRRWAGAVYCAYFQSFRQSSRRTWVLFWPRNLAQPSQKYSQVSAMQWRLPIFSLQLGRQKTQLAQGKP